MLSNKRLQLSDKGDLSRGRTWAILSAEIGQMRNGIKPNLVHVVNSRLPVFSETDKV